MSIMNGQRTHQKSVVALLASGTALMFCQGRAMATEQARYEVVASFDGIELRDYPAHVVAETEVAGDRAGAGNEGFRRLAGFIFGGNHRPAARAAGGAEKIDMTAPVAQSAASAGVRDRWRMQFIMPSRYTLATLPAPDDARVNVREMPARRFAAHRYSGTWSEESYEEALAKLQAAMARAGLRAAGEPVWARYDPPWTPWFLRRNEILIPVAP